MSILSCITKKKVGRPFPADTSKSVKTSYFYSITHRSLSVDHRCTTHPRHVVLFLKQATALPEPNLQPQLPNTSFHVSPLHTPTPP